MLTGKPVKIVSTGRYLPQKVHSSEVEKKLGIPQGWTNKYVGVDERYHVTFECNGYMGARAAEHALEKANMQLKDIDLIISAGGSYDYPIPNQASVIKNEMKDGQDVHVATIDIDSTCLSFVAAFDVASKLLDGGAMKNILIISSEISSHCLNPANWETSTLFGDAAVAAILQFDTSGESLFIKGGQRTWSKGLFDTMIKGGGVKHLFKNIPYDPETYSFKMNGKQLLRMAKSKIPEFMDWFYKDLPIDFETTPIIIPHQASKMGMTIIEGLYKLKEGQLKSTLSKYGNCIAASIPLTLHECIESGEIKRGDVCLLSGTSAGFSIGAALIKY
ncbi:MAG TPA: 3-oxoacyl-[acyl-carrier-protein] synthase III C-terminal domain-containing protein [Flavobacteriales bacterium]|nr:3-oxoacyl-[acyl-carrier-protein] synthase III C-terminal domain-containing protein [Flavobacteriales bacterium]